MTMGLIFLGQSAAQAKRGELQAKENARLRREHLFNGTTKQELSEEDTLLLADIQRQLRAGELPVSTRLCPECRRPFGLLNMRQTVVDYCTRCQGCWFDPGELGLVTGTAQDIPAVQANRRRGKHQCPVCGVPMWEQEYKKPFNLLVDRCPSGHGVYLEQGELERALRLT